MSRNMRCLLLVPFLFLPLQTAYADCLISSDEDRAWRLHGRALVDVVADCVEAGLDLSAQLPSGKVPFHEIVAIGYEPEAVAIALRAGADPNTTSRHGSPAFVDLINFSMEKDDPALLEILRLLGEAGADFSLPDDQGDLALSKATGGGEIETVRLLLEYGADPNELNTYSRTPLFETVFGRCSPDVGEVLIEHGARIDPMPEDQVARMFDQAKEACADTAGGSEYIERLRALQD